MAYQTTFPVRGSITETVTASGIINPISTVNIGTQVSGTIAEIFVDYNSPVKQGQLLGTSGRTVVAELRIGTVPIDPIAVWRGQCNGLKYY